MNAKHTYAALIGRIKDLESAVAALRESEEKYRRLVEDIGEMILVVDEKGVITFVSPQVFELGGDRAGDIIGSSILDFIHPDDIGRARENIAARIGGAPGRGVDYRVVTTFGVKWMRVSSRPIFKRGRLDGIYCVMTDVTEQKKIDEALRESEERYRFITENMNDIVWTVGLDFRAQYVSPSVERMLGFTPEERMRQTLDEMLTPESASAVRERFVEELKIEEAGADPDRTITIEGEFYRRDGTTIWLENTALFKRDPSGAAIGLYGVSRDISGRRRAEAALRESEARYRTLFNNAQVGLFRAGIADGGVIACNDRFAGLTGLATQDECRARYSDGGYLQPDERDRMMAELLSKGGLSGYEIRIIRADGSAAWASFTGTAYPAEGYFEGALVDMSEHKAAVERLRRSEERNSLILKTAMDGLVLVDAAGSLLLVNDALSSITGFGLEELSRLRVDELLTEVMGGSVEGLFALVREGPRRFETAIRGRDGSEREIEFSVSYMPHHDCVFGFVRDMRAQRVTERALMDSEEKFRRLVEEITDIIISLDERGMITYISPVAEEISGYAEREMLGRPVTDFICAEDAAAVMGNMELRRAGVVGKGSDYRMIMKSGETRWFRVSSRPVFAGGTFSGVHGVMTDITERKLAEIAITESERRLSTILQGSPIPTFVIDDDHRVIVWNKALEEYSGLKAGDVVGTREHWRAFYPVPRPCLVDIVADGEEALIDRYYAGKSRKSTIVDNAWTAIDHFPLVREGTWFMFTAAPIFDSRGGLIGAIETLQDITERVAAEQAIREGEAIARALIDTPGEPVLIVDTANVVLDCNSAFLDRDGRSRGDVVGMALRDVLEESRCDSWEARIASVRETGAPCHFEESSGDAWYETSVFPVRDADGSLGRFVIETRDVSTLMQMQRHIMHVSELERKSIGQEIHDGLGQELTGIAFLVEVLEQKMTERRYPEATDIGRIAGLIGKSIDHARLMSRTMFPARLAREGIAPALRDLAEMTGSIFNIDCACRIGESVRMEPATANQFYHVALEAVNNAIKHGAPRRIRIALEESGDRISLEVWDDGRGMDEKSVRRTGIGFNIMRYRAKIVNGELAAANAPGGGFLVSLRAPAGDR